MTASHARLTSERPRLALDAQSLLLISTNDRSLTTPTNSACVMCRMKSLAQVNGCDGMLLLMDSLPRHYLAIDTLHYTRQFET